MKEDIRSVPNIKIDTGSLSFSSVVPTLSLFAFLLLFFLVVRVGWSKISEQRRTIKDLETKQLALTERKERLEKANKDLVPLFFGISSSFLPVKSSVLLSLSAVKGFLAEYLLPVESFTISVASSPSVGDASLVASDSIRIELLGDLEQISLFLKRVEQVIPLMAIRRVSFSSEGDVISAEVEMNSFWSPYNEMQFASQKSSLPELSDGEKTALDTLSRMERVSIGSEVSSPSGPYDRSNPFAE